MNAEQQMRVNDFLVSVFNQILAWEGQTIKKVGVKNLSIRELHVIQAVSDATKLGQNTMANIAKLLAVSPGALSTSVNGLVNKGYLEREYTSKDRRVIYINLTESGEEINKIHEAFHNEMIDAVGERLDDKQLDILVEALDGLKDFFRQKMEQCK